MSTPTTSQTSLPYLRFRALAPEQRRDLRDRAGLTRRDVAAALDCAEATVRNWETPGTPHLPGRRIAAAYCRLLAEHGVTP